VLVFPRYCLSVIFSPPPTFFPPFYLFYFFLGGGGGGGSGPDFSLHADACLLCSTNIIHGSPEQTSCTNGIPKLAWSSNALFSGHVRSCCMVRRAYRDARLRSCLLMMTETLQMNLAPVLDQGPRKFKTKRVSQFAKQRPCKKRGGGELSSSHLNIGICEMKTRVVILFPE
jgi:hypothetical protein